MSISNLFDTETATKKYLFTVLNDKEENLKINEIFDAETFDTISISTFVSSPKFFFENTKQFKNITLILGIEDNNNIERFSFDSTIHNDFYKNLDKDTLEKIANENIKVFYAPIGITIHSKIYILSHSETNRKRVILGSANFTETAFGNKKQYEEVLIYDDFYNPQIVEIYEKRFSDIFKYSLNFIPDRIKKKIKDGEFIINLTDQENFEIIKENIKKQEQVVVISEDLELELIQKGLIDKENEAKKEIEVIKQTKTLLEIVTKKNKDGVMVFLPLPEIAKKQDIITSKVLKRENINIKKEFVDSRIELLYIEKENKLYKKENSNQELLPYSAELDSEIIKEKIELLDKFIQAYALFTINKEKSIQTQTRVFEVILYSFLAPYIWRIRDEYVKVHNYDEIKTLIPIFMFIAGQSNSGKTHLIKFVSQIMGNYGQYYHYIKQAKLSSMDQINPQIIDNFLNDENLTPIFVDEVNKEYFSATSTYMVGSYMGEGYIKNMTNSKNGKHPVVIATGNVDFSANPQIMKRIYYIQLDNPFDVSSNAPSKIEETSRYFNELMENFGTELYKDFLWRLENKFIDGIDINLDDFLKIGRDIFIEYFKIAEMKPAWFSSKRIDSYYIRGKEMWNRLYKAKKNGFKENKKDNEIMLDDDLIFGSKMSVNREKREWLQYLPNGTIIEEKGIVRLNRQKFLGFIESNNNVIRKLIERILPIS